MIHVHDAREKGVIVKEICRERHRSAKSRKGLTGKDGSRKRNGGGSGLLSQIHAKVVLLLDHPRVYLVVLASHAAGVVLKLGLLAVARVC